MIQYERDNVAEMQKGQGQNGPLVKPQTWRVMGTHGQTFDVAYWIIYLDRVQLGAAIPNLEADAGTFRFDPGIRACQGM
jgi:hypothetical protein